MISAKKYRLLSFLLTGIVFISGAACRSSSGDGDTPAGLVVVNAPKSGTVKRVLVREETEVLVNTVLVEIALPSNNIGSSVNANRPTTDNSMPSQSKLIADAEQESQRASVEMQRIEPLVASGAAPQAHLDAARAQYQQAQERLDQLRRQPQIVQPNSVPSQNSGNVEQAASPAENIVSVRAPVDGNVRVISARAGQTVKAGQPIATILTKQ